MRGLAQDAVVAAVELGRLQAETAPRVVVSRQADSTSATRKAMSWTPSPCSRTCSAISPSGVSGAVNTNRMSCWTMT